MKPKGKMHKKVQATIDSLKTKHGVTAFTSMQYRLWAEMYHGGVHPGLDTPPTMSMFVELVVVLQGGRSHF